jgi:hypothetical protein
MATVKAQHTPGPWEPWVGHDGYCFVPSFRCPSPPGGFEPKSEEQQAWVDADLIAAAPELLEACEALVDMYGEVAPYGQSPVVLNARAAIAKARGES